MVVDVAQALRRLLQAAVEVVHGLFLRPGGGPRKGQREDGEHFGCGSHGMLLSQSSTPLTLREPARIRKSADGETPSDLRPRPGRGIPLLDERGSRAARRHRLGEEPPRRDGRSGDRWSARCSGRNCRLGAPRTARRERDRRASYGNSGDLRTLRAAAYRIAAGSRYSPARSFAGGEVSLTTLLAGLGRGGFGRRAPTFLHA